MVDHQLQLAFLYPEDLLGPVRRLDGARVMKYYPRLVELRVMGFIYEGALALPNNRLVLAFYVAVRPPSLFFPRISPKTPLSHRSKWRHRHSPRR